VYQKKEVSMESTYFASADRSSPEIVSRQGRTFAALAVLREFADTGPYMAMVLNSNRQIVFASRALLELIGDGKCEAATGSRLGEALNCIHSSDQPGGCGTGEFCRFCGVVNAIVAAQLGRRTTRECRITRRVGSWDESLELRVFASPVAVDGEQHVICNIADTSHEHRRQALERVFFHDLMNSAGNIQGLSQVLEEIVSDEGAKWVGLLSLSARRLIGEIEGQRQLLAAENGDLMVNPSSIATRLLLEEVAGVFAASAVAPGRIVSIAAGAENANLTSDRVLLGRVLANLVKNALESSVVGDTVTLDCRSGSGLVEFRVHNPAVMPVAVTRQIFQRSFSTKGEGRGLGTYSVKLLTERYLGGHVDFHSTEGQGTTFFARYPQVLAG
jgi:signal transduction histidine kinase